MKLSDFSHEQLQDYSIYYFEKMTVLNHLFLVYGTILFLFSYIQYFFQLTIIPSKLNLFQYIVPNIRYLIEIQQYHLASMYAIFFIGTIYPVYRFYSIYPFSLKEFLIIKNETLFLLKKICGLLVILLLFIGIQWIVMEHAYEKCPYSTATIDRSCLSRATPSDSFIPHIYILGSILLFPYAFTFLSFSIDDKLLKKYDMEMLAFPYKHSKKEIIKRKLGGWF
ncbi:hypothetical protein [Moraxella sp. ZY210820]|uniref:hypothetical protein n=1 Tax=unclassified Moraxella TaxID=2685852 RepID=UPI002730A1FF|nr:hypothetical protein [Moraxella sp. ZY210820]WLF84160.1 hypothetical protein LU301_01240 [Moraxella sp. ZY210820]